MRQFKDNTGRTWSVDIHVAAVKRVRDMTGVDIYARLDGELLRRLGEDPVLLADVLWALVCRQAETAGVTDEQFGESLSGDAIDRAVTAFLEELVDFFPSRQRALARKLLEKSQASLERTMTATEAKIASPEFDAEIDAEIDRAFGLKSGDSLPPSDGGSCTDSPDTSE